MSVSSYRLKELVESMSECLDTLGTQIGLDPGSGNAAKIELGFFMMYLSASDGTISWDEAKIISEICGLNLTPNNLGQVIRDRNIYSTEFENKVPVTFDLAVRADNALLEKGITNQSLSEVMLATYKAVGEALIKSDGDVDSNEVNDYRIYTNMLEEYRDRNYAGSSGGVSGFRKNGGSSVSAPQKSGVSAPKKG